MTTHAPRMRRQLLLLFCALLLFGGLFAVPARAAEVTVATIEAPNYFEVYNAANQWGNTTPISWNEARPSDLVFVSPGWATDNHVGIVVGRNENGQLMVCHCTGGGVVVTTAGQFNYVRSATTILNRYEIPLTSEE